MLTTRRGTEQAPTIDLMKRLRISTDTESDGTRPDGGPSRAARVLVERGLLDGRVLDFGCGRGADADHFGWDGYDPVHRPFRPRGHYQSILCNGLLANLNRSHRAMLIGHIREFLLDFGRAYLVVPRNLPAAGNHDAENGVQHYVVLSLPSVYADDEFEIYELTKTGDFEDQTGDHCAA